MFRRRDFWPFISAIVLTVSLAGCTSQSELYCNATEGCAAGHPVCDVEGICPESEGIRNTCIPTACWDAGPPSGDGSIADSGNPDDPDACVAATCESLGFDCGPVGDSCGGTLSCGDCQQPEMCGFATSNVCGCTSGTWSSELVAFQGNVGEYPRLALHGGTLHAVFLNRTPTNKLVYGYRAIEASQWTFETIDDAGLDSDIFVDSSGIVHVSYWSSELNLKYARRATTGTWTTEVADADGIVGYSSSIAVDAAGAVHVGHFETATGSAILKYSRRSAQGAWTHEDIDASGNAAEFASLAVDTSGIVHVAYYDATNGALKYARRSGTWTLTTVDSAGDAGRVPSIALDSNAQPRVAYYERDSKDLKFAYRSGAVWQVEFADMHPTAAVGGGISLRIGAGDIAYVSYGDITNGDVKFASRSANGLWQPELVATQGNVGQFTSHVWDGTSAHVVYRDDSNQDLRYARRCPH